MTAIGTLLEHPYMQALAWALVHFIWQGTLIALAAKALLSVWARQVSNLRPSACKADALATELRAPRRV